jgi:hypothetical protein
LGWKWPSKDHRPVSSFGGRSDRSTPRKAATVLAGATTVGLVMLAGSAVASGAPRDSAVPVGDFYGADDTTLPCSPTPTSTTITSITNSPVVGQPLTVGVQVSQQCTEAGAGTPDGKVIVSDGTNTCTATLSGSSGVADGSCTIIETTAGAYSLSAVYNGQAQYEPSATANSTPVTVATATTSTNFQASGSGTTGSGTPVVGQPITVAVRTFAQYTGPGEPTPTGTVTVTEGPQTCTLDLSGVYGMATGSCTITETSAGTYNLTATYNGDPNFDSSTTGTFITSIAKASSTTTLALSTTTVTYGHEKTEQMSVNLAPEYPGVTPTGSVTIKASTTVLCTITLTAGQGTCNLGARTLTPGTHQLVAVYKGDPNFLTSKSAKQTLTVTG